MRARGAELSLTIVFSSELRLRAMASILADQLPDLKWRTRDSDIRGFYIVGKTEDCVEVDITESAEEPGQFRLGVYYFGPPPRPPDPEVWNPRRQALIERVLALLGDST